MASAENNGDCEINYFSHFSIQYHENNHIASLRIDIHIRRRPRVCAGDTPEYVRSFVLGIKGNYVNQFYSAAGLSNLGYINDTITHAIAVGENYTIPLGEAAGPVRAAFIRDRFTLDTSRIYEFPGTNVLPANLNGDPWKDYVCLSALRQLVTCCWEHQKLRFFTAYTLSLEEMNFAGYQYYNQEVVVHDFDSDGYDDILVEGW